MHSDWLIAELQTEAVIGSDGQGSLGLHAGPHWLLEFRWQNLLCQ